MRVLVPSMTGLAFTLSIAIGQQLFVSEAAAHHSTGLFDGTTITTIEGRVTRYAWRSPHVYVFIEGSDGSGEVAEWRFEALPIPIMVRQGWSADSLAVGDVVTAEGFRHADEREKYAWLHRLIKEDGTILDPGNTGSPAGE